MVQKFYRRRSKLIPQDWTEEIEEWEKYYMNNPYLIQQRKTWYEWEMKKRASQERRECIKILYSWKKEEEAKRFLLTPDEEKFCGHYQKGEMDDGTIVCLDCGRDLGRQQHHGTSYNHRNHVMRGKKK